VPVTLTVDVSDICDATPSCKVISITSNEPVDGKGDGHTSPDWQIVDDLRVQLRAERAGGGNGRVYTITVRCTDDSGNSATRSVGVRVAHDQSKIHHHHGHDRDHDHDHDHDRDRDHDHDRDRDRDKDHDYDVKVAVRRQE